MPDDYLSNRRRPQWVESRRSPKYPFGMADDGMGYETNRRTWRSARRFVLLWQVLMLGTALVAAVDVVAGLGWGFHARDVWGALLMSAAGFPLLAFLWFVARTVGMIHDALDRSRRGGNGGRQPED